MEKNIMPKSKRGRPPKKNFEIFTPENTEQKKEVVSTSEEVTTPEDPIKDLKFVDGQVSKNKTVASVAAEILGIVGADKYKEAIRHLNKNEFVYHQYGVMLRFQKDNPSGPENKRWIVTVGPDTRQFCQQAAYWLVDKLSSETNERIFFSPGREGIRR